MAGNDAYYVARRPLGNNKISDYLFGFTSGWNVPNLSHYQLQSLNGESHGMLKDGFGEDPENERRYQRGGIPKYEGMLFDYQRINDAIRQKLADWDAIDEMVEKHPEWDPEGVGPSGREYSFFGNNCQQFVSDILKRAGYGSF